MAAEDVLRQTAVRGREAQVQAAALAPLFEAMRATVLKEMAQGLCPVDHLRLCQARLMVMAEIERRLDADIKNGRMAEEQLAEG